MKGKLEFYGYKFEFFFFKERLVCFRVIYLVSLGFVGLGG